MGHHRKEPIPKAAGEGHGENREKPRRPRIRDYVLLVVLLALPAPVVAVITPGQREVVVVGVLLAYVFWVGVVARPVVRRIYRVYDAGLCTPAREIASWRCDRATLKEFRRGMRRRYPLTWPFRLALRPFLAGAKGYVEFRFFPEGVQIDGTLLALSMTRQFRRFGNTHIANMDILSDPCCIEFLVESSSGRNRGTERVWIPFPPDALPDAERVIRRVGTGGLTSSD
jgi:hypothetical protein